MGQLKANVDTGSDNHITTLLNKMGFFDTLERGLFKCDESLLLRHCTGRLSDKSVDNHFTLHDLIGR